MLLDDEEFYDLLEESDEWLQTVLDVLDEENDDDDELYNIIDD